MFCKGALILAVACMYGASALYVERLPSFEDLAARLLQDEVETAEWGVDAGNIPQVLSSLGLSKLVKDASKAGLVPTLSGAGPFTVFGPTNKAFEELPPYIKKAIENTTVLADVLKYHVLSGSVKSTDLKNELVANTVFGVPLRINLYTMGSNTVATAQCAPIDLKRVDQPASNGVVHVLEKVMIPPSGNIVETLVKANVFKTLIQCATSANLAPTLSGKDPLTLFAPTDEAFSKVPKETLDKLLKNVTLLAEVLEYHVVAGTACSAGLSSGNVKTVNGKDIAVKVSEDGVMVNNAKVILADTSVTNGVIHAIDSVLIPPSLTINNYNQYINNNY